MTAFNRISSVKESISVRVTEVLCEYPFVAIDKNPQNAFNSPQRIFSFLEFRLYTSISINCKITSLTDISWFAYEMIENSASSLESSQTSNDQEKYDVLPESASKFSSRFCYYREVNGLIYTSKSEDITIQARFLNIGRYLVCVNVAMLNVDGLDTTDCVYIDIVLPPLIAGIANGVARSVKHGEVVVMDALTASYDPDVNKLTDVQNPNYNFSASNLVFRMSCPFLVNGDSADLAPIEEKKLMFGNNSGRKTINQNK